MNTIEEAIRDYSREMPTKAAVKGSGSTLSYADLWKGIQAAAALYVSLPGYGRGKTVLLAAGKQIEFPIAYFGAHLAGLIVAPVAEDINSTRFDYICRSLSPFVLVGFNGAGTAIPAIPLSSFSCLPPLSGNPFSLPSTGDVADILFTTGTTGRPKCVPLTFANEFAAARQINRFVRNEKDDVEVLALPVSHSFGLGRLRCCLFNGQTIVLLGSFANVKRLFRTIRDENATGFTMVPASWKFLQKMSGNSLSEFAGQLKYIEMGSAFFSEADKRELATLFPNTRVTMHYGLTEASRSAFMEFHEDDAHLASVGRASPGVEIAIFDSSGKRLAAGNEGEICVKGPHVTSGYLFDDNAGTFFGDFFRTGDCGLMTEDGYLYLRSRMKDMINVGGKKVAPDEVEEPMRSISGVTDCACVPAPDPAGVVGEVVKAFVVKEPDSSITFDGIAAALAGKLEGYKVPVLWEWANAIPRTHNGKIQRSLLQ